MREGGYLVNGQLIRTTFLCVCELHIWLLHVVSFLFIHLLDTSRRFFGRFLVSGLLLGSLPLPPLPCSQKTSTDREATGDFAPKEPSCG